jgi:hypothetical protein
MQVEAVMRARGTVDNIAAGFTFFERSHPRGLARRLARLIRR